MNALADILCTRVLGQVLTLSSIDQPLVFGTKIAKHRKLTCVCIQRTYLIQTEPE